MAINFNFDTPKDSFSDLMGVKEKFVKNIDIDELFEISDQPFNAYADDALDILVNDIKENGLLSPLVVAPIDNGYEILAGRNRYRACKKLGMMNIPCIIRKDLNAARRKLILVSSNLKQRQKLLPSEKARAYKTYKEACDELNIKFEPDLLESSANVYKYLRLNNLTEELMRMLDNEELTFTVAYELSALSKDAQKAATEYVVNGGNISERGISELKSYDKQGVETTPELIELCEATTSNMSSPPTVQAANSRNYYQHENTSVEAAACGNANEADRGAYESNDEVCGNYIGIDKKVSQNRLKELVSNGYSINTEHTNENAVEGNETVLKEEIESDYSGEANDNAYRSVKYYPEEQEDNDDDDDDYGSRYSVVAPKEISADDELIIRRDELPWSLKRNCDMEVLKNVIMEMMPKISETYFRKN